ncbi:9911_t:CDS:1 [Cetraspora pellucida]|uniref:9911_t:CDS:1 n=1 Tax=Cetraspora pellucida TaxID=1433469 RepID=A0ACA9JYP6_9GLOM|nr:9911_t:CDS:1 [Cetraspora pellucida]
MYLSQLKRIRFTIINKIFARNLYNIKEIKQNLNSVEIKWTDEKKVSNFNYIWLRDNCQCPLCIHSDSKQKLFLTSQVELDVKPINIDKDQETLKITWSSKSDSYHQSKYSFTFLRSFNQIKSLEHIKWNNSIIQSKNIWIKHDEYMNSDEKFFDSLKTLWKYGLLFIKDVPEKSDSIKNIVKRIGTLKYTFYGETFDVVSVPNAKNIAYTNLDLGLHMDLLYYEAPPGLQFLHCLKNSVEGGYSIFADSFAAVDNFKSEYPLDYSLLTKIPITFHYMNNGHHMHYNRPMIEFDHFNNTFCVNYSPPFQGPIESLLDKNENEIFKFYQAYNRFCLFIEDPNLKFNIKLKPSEMVIFMNRRVLHGRTSFNPQSGERYLIGAYLELCEFKDKLRVLMRSFDEVNDLKEI